MLIAPILHTMVPDTLYKRTRNRRFQAIHTRLARIFFITCLMSAFTISWASEGELKSNLDSCINIEDQNILSETRRIDKALIRKLEDKKIGNIEVVVEKIFDESNPDEDKALYRLANRLQVNTRENVIGNQLLFATGDSVRLSKLEESLRILYSREYLLDASLFATRVCGDVVDIRVVVKDAWVIEPKISFGRKGGETSSGFGLRDGNFLGTGNDVALIYKRNPDRNQVIYRFRTQNFLGKRLEADVYHAELSDGTNSRLSLAKPFYSTDTKWAYGAETGETSLRYKTRFDDAILNEFTQTTSLDSAFIGSAIRRKETYTFRLKLGYTKEKNRFTSVEETVRLPDGEEQSYPWVELEKVTNMFERYSNLSYIARAEDIEIGANYRVRLGVGSGTQGERIYRLLSNYSTVLGISEDHLFRFELHTDLVKRDEEEESFQDSIAGLSSTYNYFINGKNRWQFAIRYDEGKNLSEQRQLTLGEVTGMRGYPLSYQRGDKRYVLNVERRFYSNAHFWNLIRFGAVVFADFGRAWGAEAFANTEHLRSVGVGLRFHSSKTGTPAVVHLNVGSPLTDNDNLDDYLVSVSVESVF